MSAVDPELRARVAAQYGTGIPATDYRTDPRSTARIEPAAPAKTARGADRRTAAQNALAGSRRGKTGASFEAQLDETHAWLTARGYGHVLPHYPPTNAIPSKSGGPPKLVKRKGGGPCDYSGHVNMIPGSRPATWSLCEPNAPRRVQIPVVFDAKVLNASHASYTHDRERIVQIKHLANAQQGGAIAMLLVRADKIGRLFAISYANHADELLRSRPIKLYDTIERGEVFPVLPSVGYTPGSGWLWPNLLPYLLP